MPVAGPTERRTSRLEGGRDAFAFLAGLATRRERVSYADFAFALGLGSPRGLSWLLGPLLRWCAAEGLPPLPIIVVRRSDGLPSGGYDPATVEAETLRVFDREWATVRPPDASDLLPHARPPGVRRLRRAACP